MSSNYLTTPKFRSADPTTGLARVGYKLYTYSPATTTPKATYPTVADMLALTNANTNPVILDTNGEALVVLKGTTKLVLKDTLDNTVWTVDNVEPNSVQMDANGNELFKYSATASAVNEITVANAATGLSPTISATGDDTNIGLNISAKGTGLVTISNLYAPSFSLAGEVTVAGTGGEPGSIKLFEQTTNGTNYVKIAAGATLASNSNYVWPLVQGANRALLQTDASGNLTWNAPGAETAGYALVTDGSGVYSWQIPQTAVATQSDMETATSVTTFVTPLRQQFHPSASKAWVYCGVAGNILASYNVTSLVDVGAGQVTVNYTTAFSSGNYSAVPAIFNNGGTALCVSYSALVTTSVTITCRIASSSAATDSNNYSLVCLGGQ